MNSDDLRWILAGCGALVVAGIYLLDRFRRKARDKSEEASCPDSGLPVDGFSLRAGDPESNEELELPSMRNERFEPSRHDAPVKDDNSEIDENPVERPGTRERKGPSGIIQIKVTAPQGMWFAGTRLIESLKSIGLEYGSMKIFHRQQPGTLTPLFSVVNLVEPGTFPADDPSRFQSPGVVFFLQLAVSEQPLIAFEEMVRSARLFAAQIGGEVRDETNAPLTAEKTEAIRESLAPVSG